MNYKAMLGNFKGKGSIICTSKGSRFYLEGRFYPGEEDLGTLMQQEREKMIFKGMMIDDDSGKPLARIETTVTVFHFDTDEYIELMGIQEPSIIERMTSW